MSDTDTDTDTDELIELYDIQRHRGGDETPVLLTQFGDGFQALAFDVGPDGRLLDTDEIGGAETRETAESMCEYWLATHSKGILGTEPDESGPLSGLFGGDSGPQFIPEPTPPDEVDADSDAHAGSLSDGMFGDASWLGTGDDELPVVPFVGGAVLFVVLLILFATVLGFGGIGAFLGAAIVTGAFVGGPFAYRALARRQGGEAA